MDTDAYSQAKFAQMFVAALVIVDNKWKQPKGPSTDKWINKRWHIPTVE